MEADTGNYHCRVSDGQTRQSILTESVSVALAYQNEKATDGVRSPHQLRRTEGINVLYNYNECACMRVVDSANILSLS